MSIFQAYVQAEKFLATNLTGGLTASNPKLFYFCFVALESINKRLLSRVAGFGH